MGKSPSAETQISRWERGESSPAALELWRYLLAIGASFSDLDRELHPEINNPRLQELAEKLEQLGR